MINIKDLQKVASSLNILYVEDDEDIAKTIISYLSKLFKEVVYAPNGEEGLDLYKQGQYDIVITDINMPKMSGLEMATKIKEINNNQNIIIISAYSDVENFVTSIELGIDGYIIKPTKYNEMNSILYKLSNKIKNSYENSINNEQQQFLMEHITQKNILLRQYTEVIDKVAIVSKTDLKGVITYANDFFCEVSGYTKDEIIGKTHNIVRHEDMVKAVYADLWKTIQDGNMWEGTIKNKAKNGEPYFVHSTIFPIFDDKNNISEYIGIRFLTTKEEMEKREFKKKVRSSYQEYKKSNQEANIQIKALKEQLSNQIKNDYLQNDLINAYKIRLAKAASQIDFYEKRIEKIESHHEKKLENHGKSVFEISERLKESSKELSKKKDYIKSLQDDNEEKKQEILKLNSEIIDQRDIIKDLRDTIKNIDEIHEDKDRASLFDKFIKI